MKKNFLPLISLLFLTSCQNPFQPVTTTQYIYKGEGDPGIAIIWGVDWSYAKEEDSSCYLYAFTAPIGKDCYDFSQIWVTLSVKEEADKSYTELARSSFDISVYDSQDITTQKANSKDDFKCCAKLSLDNYLSSHSQSSFYTRVAIHYASTGSVANEYSESFDLGIALKTSFNSQSQAVFEEATF